MLITALVDRSSSPFAKVSWGQPAKLGVYTSVGADCRKPTIVYQFWCQVQRTVVLLRGGAEKGTARFRPTAARQPFQETRLEAGATEIITVNVWVLDFKMRFLCEWVLPSPENLTVHSRLIDHVYASTF